MTKKTKILLTSLIIMILVISCAKDNPSKPDTSKNDPLRKTWVQIDDSTSIYKYEGDTLSYTFNGDIINGAFTVYTVADILWDSGNTSGIMYLQYTKSPIATHIGKYYAIAFKDLTDTSVSFCTASDPNTPYRDTLDEAKKDYSKENASTYFAEYRYQNYNVQAN